MILVTGATGTVGAQVVRCLPAGTAARIMARNPAAVANVPEGAQVVAGDYGDDRSLREALAGVRAVFLVTSRVGGDDDARFLAAARAAGVRHVVKLSAAAVEDPEADDLITGWQRGNEDLLRRSGMAFTLLRPRSFMSNTLGWAPSMRREGVVRALYGTSLNACVAPEDIARVAVRVLTGGGYEGRALVLTGPRAISAVEQTRCLAKALGIPLRFEELPPEAARTALLARYPVDVAEALLASAHRQQAGAKARVDDAVATVTGRQAMPFAAWAAAHAVRFAALGEGAAQQAGGRKRTVDRKTGSPF